MTLLSPSRLLVAAVLAVAALAWPAGPLAATPAAALPHVGHVFVLALENENEATSFGPGSPAPYLAKDLPAMGQMLPNYYGIGHASLDNYIALISGQGPNPTTQSDCQFFMDVLPGTIGGDGQATGSGCVYPTAVKTVADQLTARGLTWKGYMEDMGNSPTESRTCRHPALNSRDNTQSARVGDQYATRHNPFVYFHSIIDSPDCFAKDVPLDRLSDDLRSVSSTPNYSFITPNLCNDGHDAPCVDGRPGGLTTAGQFASALVPQIVASPAFRQDGLLIVTFDESASGAESCCGERAANTPNAGATTRGPGGGRVGAVVVSPFVAPGTVNQTPYNHYGLLRTVEDAFGLSHLGYAGVDGLQSFGGDVFNASAASTPSAQRPSSPVRPGTLACRALALPRRAHGNLRRGTLIARAALRRRGHRFELALTFTHAARLNISVRVHGHLRRRRTRHVRACRAYRLRVPAGARVMVSVSVRGARERRRLHPR